MSSIEKRSARRERTIDSGRYCPSRSSPMSPSGITSMMVMSMPRPCAQATRSPSSSSLTPLSATALILTLSPAAWAASMPRKHLGQIAPAGDGAELVGIERVERDVDALDAIALELGGIFAELRAVGGHGQFVQRAGVDTLQGTNLQHGLMLARRFLARHRDAEPVVLVVTDGEPTAHLEEDGTPFFCWPPMPETIARTVAEVERVARTGATVNVFALDPDPGLVALRPRPHPARRRAGVPARRRPARRVRGGRLPAGTRGRRAR